MGKASKILVVTAVSLVVVIVAAMVLATVFIDPNNYKDQITQVVKDKTGRTITFDGDFKLSVFPWIGVTTGGITLSNAEGFSEKNMLSLKSADVSLKVFPLLFGKVKLGNIDVEDLQLYLMRNNQGITNWDDLAGDKPEKYANAEKQKSDTPVKSFSGGPEINISVGGVSVQNAKVVWDDRKENVRHAVEDCDITVDGFAPGSPFKFNVQVQVSSTSPEIDARIGTSGTAEISGDLKKIGVKDLSVVVDASGADVPGGKGQVKISGDAAIDMLKGAADVNGLAFEAYGMKAEGGLKATGFNGDKLKFSGDLSVPSFSLKDSLQKMAVELKTSDSKALSSVGMNFVFSGTGKSVKVENLLINLDETTIKGLMSFVNPDNPNIVAQIDINTFDLDRYLPPEGAEKRAEKVEIKEDKDTPASKEAENELLPVDLLRKLTLKADLTIKQLIAGKARLSDIVVRARAAGGVLNVKPASLNVANGAFTSAAVVDVRGKLPSIKASAGLTGLDGTVLSQDMTGGDSFSGKMSFNTQLATVGNDMKTIYSNLNGDFAFKVIDGYVSGFDLIYLAGDAFSVLTGGAFGKRDNKRTEFGEVSATAVIRNGVAVNKDLLMQSPLLRAAGAGNMDLNTMTLKYALDAKIVGSFEGQGGKGMKDLVGLTVPVTITGNVADPSIMVDLPRFAAILAKSGVRVVGSVVEGVGDMIEGIGNAFSGKQSTRKESTGTDKKDKNTVQELGNSIKKLF